MIVVETNVISEMMRDRPDSTVLDWVATAGPLHTTAVTLAEIEYGFARLQAGRRPVADAISSPPRRRRSLVTSRT